MDGVLELPPAPKTTRSTATSIVTIAQVKKSSNPLPLPKPDYHFKKLRKLGVVFFLILIIASIAAAMIYLYLWSILEHLDELTNMYPAFFGFLSAAVINIVASIAGLVTLYEPEDEFGEIIDKSHSKAVTWLLIAGICFNVIFPTAGLMPLESDSKMRLPKTSISDCSSLEYMQIPECSKYGRTSSVLYMMYLLIIVEGITLIFYACVWLRRRTVVAFLKLLKRVKIEEAIDPRMEYSLFETDDEWTKVAKALDREDNKIDINSQSHSLSEFY